MPMYEPSDTMLNGSRASPIAGLALTVLLCGCVDTVAPVAELTPAHASLASGELLRLGALGIEWATALHEATPVSLCPIISVDGDQTVLDYGGGCTPDSGTTEQGVSGQIYFTIAPSTGWFVGEFNGVGYSSHAISGQVSGSHTRSGSTALFDLLFEGVQRMDRDDLSISALFEVEARDASFTVQVDNGLMTGPSGADTEITLADVTLHDGLLDACVLPISGSIELQRGYLRGILEFSEDAASSGLIPFSLDGEESPPVLLCP